MITRIISPKPHIPHKNELIETKHMTKIEYIRISGPPVEVGVTMYVLSISSLSEVKMVQKYDFVP